MKTVAALVLVAERFVHSSLGVLINVLAIPVMSFALVPAVTLSRHVDAELERRRTGVAEPRHALVHAVNDDPEAPGLVWSSYL